MLRSLDWRLAAALLLLAGAPSASSPDPAPLDGAWVARNVRWQAPRAGTEGASARQRPSETLILDLALEIRQVGDSLAARLSNVRDPEDVQWTRVLVGRLVGDSVFLAATAGPGAPNLSFEGTVQEAQLAGRLNAPPPHDTRPALLRTTQKATGRQAIPAFPSRDQWIAIKFHRAPS